MKPSPNDLAIIEEQAAEWLLYLEDEQKIAQNIPNHYPKELNDWLAESVVHREVFEKMQHFWAISTQLDSGFVAQQLTELDSIAAANSKPIYRSLVGYLAIAATFLLFGFIFFMEQEQPVLETTVASTANRQAVQVSNAFYRTKINEHRTITLADNSQVDLGANSQLAVRYNDKSRELILYQGEALFNVSKDKQRPFTVRYQNSEVKALGTVFNVRANLTSIRVDVLEGSVSVKQQEAVTLTQGQAVEITESGTITHSKAQGDALTMAWQKGYLVYQNARLGDVLNDITRYSEIQVDLTNQQLAKLTYNGTFLTSEIDAWLNSLEKIYPITVTRKDKIFTISAN